MADHEKYVVETEYKVDDKASAAAARIERSFKFLSQEAHKLKEKFHEFRNEQRFTAAAMLGVGFGLGAWVEKSKEAVGEFTRVRKSLAGLFSETLNWPSATSGIDKYRSSIKLADDVTEELEETVAQYGGSLDEAAAGFRGMTAAVGPAHLKPKQLMELYKNVAATAKATSTDVTMAAEQVGRAIMTGSVRPVGVLGKELYQAMHAHGKLTKQMGLSGRLNIVSQMMKGQKPIADEMSKGIGDSLRKIQISVERIFRLVGAPLFAAIAKELNGWANSLTKASHEAKPLAEVFGEKLATGFKFLKEATTFIAEHWKSIAAAWATMKIGSLAGGAAGFMGNLSQAIGGSLGASMGTMSKGFATVAGKAVALAGALEAAYLAGSAFGDWIASKMSKETEIKGHGVGMLDAARMLSTVAKQGESTPRLAKLTEKALKDLAESGAVRNGKLDRGAMVTNISRLSDDDRGMLAKYLGIQYSPSKFGFLAPGSEMPEAEQTADLLAAKLAPLIAGRKVEAATEVNASNLKTKGAQIGPFTGAINITQKFDDVDPDRVWVATRRGIQENAERAVRSMHADPWSE